MFDQNSLYLAYTTNAKTNQLSYFGVSGDSLWIITTQQVIEVDLNNKNSSVRYSVPDPKLYSISESYGGYLFNGNPFWAVRYDGTPNVTYSWQSNSLTTVMSSNSLFHIYGACDSIALVGVTGSYEIVTISPSLTPTYTGLYSSDLYDGDNTRPMICFNSSLALFASTPSGSTIDLLGISSTSVSTITSVSGDTLFALKMVGGSAALFVNVHNPTNYTFTALFYDGSTTNQISNNNWVYYYDEMFLSDDSDNIGYLGTDQTWLVVPARFSDIGYEVLITDGISLVRSDVLPGPFSSRFSAGASFNATSVLAGNITANDGITYTVSRGSSLGDLVWSTIPQTNSFPLRSFGSFGAGSHTFGNTARFWAAGLDSQNRYAVRYFFSTNGGDPSMDLNAPFDPSLNIDNPFSSPFKAKSANSNTLFTLAPDPQYGLELWKNNGSWSLVVDATAGPSWSTSLDFWPDSQNGVYVSWQDGLFLKVHYYNDQLQLTDCSGTPGPDFTQSYALNPPILVDDKLFVVMEYLNSTSDKNSIFLKCFPTGPVNSTFNGLSNFTLETDPIQHNNLAWFIYGYQVFSVNMTEDGVTNQGDPASARSLASVQNQLVVDLAAENSSLNVFHPNASFPLNATLTPLEGVNFPNTISLHQNNDYSQGPVPICGDTALYIFYNYVKKSVEYGFINESFQVEYVPINPGFIGLSCRSSNTPKDFYFTAQAISRDPDLPSIYFSPIANMEVNSAIDSYNSLLFNPTCISEDRCDQLLAFAWYNGQLGPVVWSPFSCKPGSYSMSQDPASSRSCIDCDSSLSCTGGFGKSGMSCASGYYLTDDSTYPITCSECPSDATCSGGSDSPSCRNREMEWNSGEKMCMMKPPSDELTGGQIAGIIIGILLVIGVAAIVYVKRNQLRQGLQKALTPSQQGLINKSSAPPSTAEVIELSGNPSDWPIFIVTSTPSEPEHLNVSPGQTVQVSEQRGDIYICHLLGRKNKGIKGTIPSYCLKRLPGDNKPIPSSIGQDDVPI